MHMPKHEAATWFKDDAETQKLSLRNTDAETQWNRYDAETRTLTVSSQDRHSQRAQFTWLKQPVNCDAETASAAMKRSRYTSRNSDALLSPCISIRLHENRIPYADLERRSELV
jgi:hypothetical protein